MMQIFLVDDNALLFENEESVRKCTPIDKEHLRRFGLLMHVGITKEDGK